MGIKLSNNAFGTLAASITSSSTSITLTTGQGARFPTLAGGDYFYATLVDTSNNLEIVKCTARSTDVLTVVRAQESTTARAYNTGDRIEIRLTAQTFIDAVNEIGPTQVSDEANTSTGYFELPAGTTAQRPASPNGRMIRKNTTTGYIEYYDTTVSQWIGIGAFQASGGTETTYESGGTTYRVHTFTSSSTFQVLAGTKQVDVLLVAGGGAGGTNAGAGGGAGGLIYQTSVSVLQGALPIIVGAGGGNGGSDGSATGSGSNSTGLGYTAIGGGGGINSNGKGASGGSGGGSSVSQTGGAGTSGQGNKGGDGNGSDGAQRAGGGGGGAGAAGQNVQSDTMAGQGGNGLQYSINGTTTYYAGGGGGASHTGNLIRSGGLGGGGNSGYSNMTGSGTAGQAGSANTGGGGGAGSGGGFIGGNGGSGIVIIRYPV
jgi:hypothetical protein